MFILIFERLLKMFFIMVLAFVCYKIRLVDQNGNKTVSNLLLLVVNPILIITVYQTEYDPELVRGLLLSFAAVAATHILGIIISTLLIRPKDGTDYSIERFNAMYSNCGFIGIPLIGSVLGDTGVFYLSAYMVMFNLFSWTHGIVLMEKKLSLKSLKEGLISPMFIATLVAVLLFFLRLKIPSVLLDSMNYIADMNTPLAMMVAGFSVAQADLGKMCKNPRLYYTSAVKLFADLPCLHDTTAHALPSADSDIHDDSDRAGMSVGHHRHDDGDPLQTQLYLFFRDLFPDNCAWRSDNAGACPDRGAGTVDHMSKRISLFCQAIFIPHSSATPPY